MAIRQTVSEGEDHAVDRDRVQPRQTRRAQLHQRIDTPHGNEQSGRAAHGPEHHALREQLADDARAAGAERAPNGNLALADRRSREQQVGDVGTGDQQHEADRGEQRQQRGTYVADQIVAERITYNARPLGG